MGVPTFSMCDCGALHLTPVYNFQWVFYCNEEVYFAPWSRWDVQTCTSWRAPIMWNEMFEKAIYDQYHVEKDTSVALTVFAVGRYLEVYLKEFLISAERHFMVGLPVDYYIFTDVPHNVPTVQLAPGRTLRAIPVKKYERWQDISMMRMKAITEAIDNLISTRNQYVFCMDVDQVFVGPFGSEALGDSVALLHAYFYKSSVTEYTYDRNPKSVAYMNDGDYYYHAAVFGGTWQNVRNITESCHRGIKTDKVNDVEALWHDESHLNKYFWLHKPSKVLSPEYLWASEIGFTYEIHVRRMIWAEKHYGVLRD
ncbi:N-acetyllactosaminide alpha-1,3-galactosyltransferase-like [Clupea harengus]|uniref:N-acetyllactosaminide alpha-1,3-galactosyltransferase-like n=1 Tax=Clupea harengus TaxID=7950 RepID=A0A6P8F9I5_CLUHA|nr:N-acetyllactosaminide alpha-1,3-galactosyltransferase-like [Clupea harengus]